MDRGLIRYWFEYDPTPVECGGEVVLYPREPIGVTAFDLDDARALIRAMFFNEDEARLAPDHITEDVDLSQLDERRRRHMGVPIWRGVWYPRALHDLTPDGIPAIAVPIAPCG